MIIRNMHIDTSKFKGNPEYVCWIDIMGTKNTMSESFEKAANFILKFHSCVIEATKDINDVKTYPLMDGVFIVAPNNKIIRGIIDEIFSSVANIFLAEKKNGYRFIIKGSLSYGHISHGENISEEICQQIATDIAYKRAIMCGMPMIQAFVAEHTAPPFGVYIHESARRPEELQGKYYNWRFKNGVDKSALLTAILNYFSWCEYYKHYLELDLNKIALYKSLSIEFFSNRMDVDKPDNPWL